MVSDRVSLFLKQLLLLQIRDAYRTLFMKGRGIQSSSFAIDSNKAKMNETHLNGSEWDFIYAAPLAFEVTDDKVLL